MIDTLTFQKSFESWRHVGRHKNINWLDNIKIAMYLFLPFVKSLNLLEYFQASLFGHLVI
jgi:hypothetical protein